MNFIIATLKFLVDQIFTAPAFLLGLTVLIGLILQKKPIGEIVTNTFKAIMGFLILALGAQTIFSALVPLNRMILGTVNAKGFLPTNDPIISLVQQRFEITVTYVVIFGFIVALLLAKFTPLKYVFLSGHNVFFMATLITILLATTQMNNTLLVALAAVALGIAMVAMPAFLQPYTKKITGNNEIAVGNFASIGYLTAGITGTLVGKKSKSTEDLKLPKSLNFLRDSFVAPAVAMISFYLIFALVYLIKAGSSQAFTAFGQNATSVNMGTYLIKALTNGLQFGIGFALIIYAVKIIMSELIPAFQGISQRIIPNAIPAVDSQLLFPKAPNAVLFGFIFSLVGGLLSLLLIVVVFGPAFGLAVILPGLVPHFFTGGTAGIFGNATGGRRGAMVGGLVNGILITFLPALLMSIMQTLNLGNTTFENTDYAFYGILIGLGVKAGLVVGIIVILAMSVFVLAMAILWQKKRVLSDWEPAKAHSDFLAKTNGSDKAKHKK